MFLLELRLNLLGIIIKFSNGISEKVKSQKKEGVKTRITEVGVLRKGSKPLVSEVLS